MASVMPKIRGGKRRTYKRRTSMKGGFGGADNAISVFGDMKDQHASSGGNTIAMSQIKCGGGKVRGGNMVTDLGVPAVLVAANHFYKKRNGTKKGGKRRGTKKGGARCNK